MGAANEVQFTSKAKKTMAEAKGVLSGCGCAVVETAKSVCGASSIHLKPV